MIRLSLPDIGEEELQEIKSVLESGWLVQGDKVEEFENIVKDYLKVKHAIALSSGTAALHLSLMALEISNESEIIVPDFTFPATSNVVEIVGGKSVFVDIELDTFNIDPDKIEEKITRNTKAIIVVHEFGCPAKMDEILAIANKYNLSIIEDAACALGSEYKGIKVGTIGDIGCFSLHPRKNITTGEGGIIVTNNDDYAEKIRMLKNHGISNNSGKITFEMAGLNYRLTNIQGAMGVAQMRKLHSIMQKRREIAKTYDKLLRNIQWLTLPKEPQYGLHAWQSYHILLNEKIDRERFIAYMKENGIETNYGAYAVHIQPYYSRKYKYKDFDFTNALKAAKHGVVLPLHSKLSEIEVEKISETIKRYPML